MPGVPDECAERRRRGDDEGARVGIARLVLRPGERGHPDHEREDSHPDRERAERPRRVIEDAPLVDEGRIAPRGREMTHERREAEDRPDDERDGARPVPSRPGRPPPSRRLRLPGEPQQSEREHREEHRELRARERSQRRRSERGGEAAPARSRDEPGDEPERERGERVREGLLDEERRVGEGGERDRRARGSERVPARRDHACEPVGGEDGARHRQDEQQLPGRIRARGAAEPPHGREDVRDQRGQPVRLVETRGLPGRGDRPARAASARARP